MRLFINASNLRFGGGKTVGFNIINYYVSHPDISGMVITAPAGCGYEQFDGISEKVKMVYFHKIFNVSVFKILSNYLLLPLYLLLYKNDFVLSLGNVAIPTRKPQFLLIHQSYLAYPESVVWERIKKDDRRFYIYVSNMLRFIKANLRYASVVGVQTAAMKVRISSLYKIPAENVFVIPNAVSFTSEKVNGAAESITTRNKDEIKLLFLSKHYPHKNFEILYEVGKEIVRKSLPIKISVTIDPAENEGSRLFLENIKNMQLDSVIVNMGNVPLAAISDAYGKHDGLFLPTLLESFSGSYIEAMYFNRPIFTSDLDFAHEVCKDAAYYFNPVSANSIIDTILKAFDNPDEMSVKVKKGMEIIGESKSWNDIGKFIDTKILKLV